MCIRDRYSLVPTNYTFKSSTEPDNGVPHNTDQLGSTLIAIESPLLASPKTVSVSYGPFNITPKAMMPEVILRNISKPCMGCSITAMRAFLSNSTSQLSLGPDTGIHLHHFIFFNDGLPDLVCPQFGERFFGGSNDQWTRRWGGDGEYGYKVDAGDEWSAVVEVMNDADWEGEVEVTVLFEVEGDKSMKDVRPIYLDASGCGDGGVEVKSTTAPFEYEVPEWVSPIDGTLLDVSLLFMSQEIG